MEQPEEEKIQIIVFGTGYGESILVHLGSRNWVIVDTCNIMRKPAVLVYFEKIGVDVKSEVKLIVATHWHQDHTLEYILHVVYRKQKVFHRQNLNSLHYVAILLYNCITGM